MNDQDFMREAIRQARDGIAAQQTPFGAVVVREGTIVAATHNTVWKDCDPTAHAEINALRVAARSLDRIDLSGCTVYSTCEPCPMCIAAIHWSKADRVVFGATIADAQRAGFEELPIAARTLAEMGNSPLQVEGGVLLDECAALFDEWKRRGQAQTY